MERAVRKPQFEVDTGVGDDAIPCAQHRLAVVDVVVAQPRVDRAERRRIDPLETSVDVLQYAIRRALQLMVVVDLVFVKAPLDAGVERVRRVRRDLGAEQIERYGVVEVDLLLNRRQVDDAVPAHRRRCRAGR